MLFLSVMDANSESEEYDDSDSESEDPFTSHQARRQASSGSQRGAMAPFYNYPGAGWTPPFSSAPPLPWVTQTLRHTDRQTDKTCWMFSDTHQPCDSVATSGPSGTFTLLTPISDQGPSGEKHNTESESTLRRELWAKILVHHFRFTHVWCDLYITQISKLRSSLLKERQIRHEVTPVN